MKKLLITGSLVTLSLSSFAQEVGTVGGGFNSYNESYTPSCVSGKIVTTSRAQFNSAFLNKGQLEESLNVKIGSRGRIDLISHSGSAKFFNSTFETSQSSSFTKADEFIVETAALTKPELKPSYADLQKNPEKFLQQCGDRFISSQDFGIRLFTSLKLHFPSKEAKAAFDSKFKYHSLTEVLDHVPSDVSATVSFFQEGGDVKKISRHFNANNYSNLNAYGELKCSAENLNTCYQLLKDLNLYAARFMPKQANSDFPLAYVGETQEKYLLIGNIKMNDSIHLSIREILSQLFETTLQQRNLINTSLKEMKLSWIQKEQLIHLQPIAEMQVQRAAEGLELCFEDSETCLDAFLSLDPKSRTGLKIFPEADINF